MPGPTTYRAQFAELQRRGAADQDLAATLPPLDTLRNIRGGYGQRDLDAPLALTFGLYQGTKLSQARAGRVCERAEPACCCRGC